MLKKLSYSVVLLLLWCSTALAQSPTSIVGLWKITHFFDPQGVNQIEQPVFYKLYDAQGNYTAYQLSPKGLQITSEGTYVVDGDKKSISETVKKTNQLNFNHNLQTNVLAISIVENTLEIKGQVALGERSIAIHEKWEKVGY